MNNQILDDLFHDDLRGQLQKDEKVIWEGRPALTDIDKFWMGLQWVLIAFIIYYSIVNEFDSIVLIVGVVMLASQLINYLKIRKTRYLLTDQRLFFQINEKRKKHIHDIPLKDIKTLTIEKNGKDNGVIFIWRKNPRATIFKTKNLKNGQERTRPTLEFIDDVEKVKEYIQTAVTKKLK